MQVGEWFGLGGLVLGGGSLVTVLKALWEHGKRHVEMDAQLLAGQRRFESIERHFVTVKSDLDSYRKTEDRRHDALDRKMESIHGDIRDLTLILKLRKPGNGFPRGSDEDRED